MTLFAQGQKSKLQAHVFAVVTFAYSLCPVVYAERAGVRATTYVSSHPASAQYVHVQLCICVAKSAGVENNGAQVSPVAVPAVFCAVVACSTLPATVVLAFAVTVPWSLSTHAPHT